MNGLALVLAPISLTVVCQAQDLCQTQAILGPDLDVPENRFGYGIEVDGEWLAISDPFGAANVNLYRRSVDTWTFETVLEAPDGPISAVIGFSSDVDLEGGQILVGAPAWFFGQAIHGSANLYTLPTPGEEPELVTTLTESTPFVDRYGWNVALDTTPTGGSMAFVSAPNDAPVCQGAVYVYELDGSGDSVLVQELKASDPTPDHEFGGALDAQDGTLVVGTGLIGTQTEGFSGVNSAVYVFERDPGALTYSQTQKIATPDPNIRIAFDATLDGDRLLFGASEFIPLVGRLPIAYLYERNAEGEFVEAMRLDPSIPATGFVGRVAIEGDTIILRARVGLVSWISVFREFDGTWLEVEVFEGSPNSGSGYIGDVALRGDVWLQGRKGFGTAGGFQPPRVVERRTPGFVRDLGPGLAGTLLPDLQISGCYSSGSNAVIGVVGRPLTIGFLLASTESVDLPVFGGSLYVGTPLTTNLVHSLNASGQYDVTCPLGLVGGQSFSIQAAYLDSSAPQGVSLSNGIELFVR